MRQSVPRGRFFQTRDRTVQKDLDIQEYTDPEHNPMIPHTLVLKPGLVIYSIYNGYWFWGRPSIIDLWRDLRAVTSEIRPDWDLSNPNFERRGRPVTTRVSTDGINVRVQKQTRLHVGNNPATKADPLRNRTNRRQILKLTPEVNGNH